MGALVAGYAARAHQDWFNGLIMTSPAVDVDKNLTLKIQSLFGAPLQAIAPWARLVPAVQVDCLSESEEVCVLFCYRLPGYSKLVQTLAFCLVQHMLCARTASMCFLGR